MRYVVVGLGNIGTKRKLILKDRCVATVDPFRTDAQFADIDAVPPESYDAAILSVPNAAKLPLLRKLLTKGKHVLVEKPLLALGDWDALLALAKGHGCIWYTSYNHRFEPQLVVLKTLLSENRVGALYHAHLLYGNGTVRSSLGTWREAGLGVLEDLGPHLIDLADHLFAYRGSYALIDARPLESKVIDHCRLLSEDRKLILECGLTYWKNTFRIDAYGERGSIHVDGLAKWGACELIVRERVYPSGVPHELRTVDREPDATWSRDLVEFEERMALGITSMETDRAIERSLVALGNARSERCPPRSAMSSFREPARE